MTFKHQGQDVGGAWHDRDKGSDLTSAVSKCRREHGEEVGSFQMKVDGKIIRGGPGCCQKSQ